MALVSYKNCSSVLDTETLIFGTYSAFSVLVIPSCCSEASERIMRMITEREWGMLLLDEVHVVPAAMFRKVGDLALSGQVLRGRATPNNV